MRLGLTESFPPRPAPFKATVAGPPLLVMTIVAAGLAALGSSAAILQVTLTLTLLPEGMLSKLLGATAKHEVGGLIVMFPESGPLFFPAFLMTRAFVAVAPLPMPTAFSVTDDATDSTEPFGVALAVGEPDCVAVAVAVGVGLPAAGVPKGPELYAPRPWVPTKMTPLLFCTMS